MSAAGTSAANVLRLGKSWWKVPFLTARSRMAVVVPFRVVTITRMRRPAATPSATASSALPSRVAWRVGAEVEDVESLYEDPDRRYWAEDSVAQRAVTIRARPRTLRR